MNQAETRAELIGIPAGAGMSALETFARPPDPQTMKGLAVYDTAATGPLAGSIEYADGGFALCADGSARINGIPEAVRSFAVSGYRVLPRWLASRGGQEIGEQFVPELRDLVGKSASRLTSSRPPIAFWRTLDEPLSRAALGLDDLPTPAPEAASEAPVTNDE